MTEQQYPGLETLNTESLISALEIAEVSGDTALVERCETELARRDYDESDPASPQNTAADGYDRNGAFDGTNVISDADGGL